jgi:aubergine-like protein
VINCDE